MVNAAIEVINLTKDYISVRALDKVSFEVKQGECFGLLGPNGAGKTTLMKILLNLISPSSGLATIFNQPVKNEKIREKIGYLPEKVENGPVEAHEALMLFNATDGPASVRLDFYFEDRAPVKGVPVEVEAERVKALRLDRAAEFGGPDLALQTQYALRVRSDVPIVAMHGRVDTTQQAMAYYSNIAYAEE